MQKQCKQCWIEFDITQDDLDFFDKISPIINWNKYLVPSPTLCYDCRQQRKTAWRNERKFYRRKCDLSGQDMVSIYCTDSKFKVYKNTEYYSDKWDAFDYWMDFDFKKTFFEQFEQLHIKVPKPSIYVYNSENCEYTNLNSWNKNCYLTVAASDNEDCYYSTYLQWNKNLVDCLFIFNSEIAYECVDCYDSYKLFFSQSSNNCSESYYLYNCQWSKYCFWCVNLVNKQYYIFNKQYDKISYFEKISILLKEQGNYTITLEKFNNLKNTLPHKSFDWINNENVIWDHISYSKDSENCFDCTYLENCKNCTWMHRSSDCYDCYAWWLWWELWYENHLCWNKFFRVLFCESCEDWNSNLFYCRNCRSSSNLFGCVWLIKKNYCIFNKQYSKQEYENQVSRIIEHMQNTWEWWEFFPARLSPFSYNETFAQEHFPLSKDQILSKWWKWKDEEDKIPDVQKIIPAEKLPDKISDIPDDILSWAIKCEVSWRPFKIIAQELKFYRENNISIPHLHPDERHLSRMKLRNSRILYDRKCMNCEKNIQTPYNLEDWKIVYCEDCYLKDVF